MLDDPFRQSFTHARQQGPLRPVGPIDVDFKRCQLHRRLLIPLTWIGDQRPLGQLAQTAASDIDEQTEPTDREDRQRGPLIGRPHDPSPFHPLARRTTHGKSLPLVRPTRISRRVSRLTGLRPRVRCPASRVAGIMAWYLASDESPPVEFAPVNKDFSQLVWDERLDDDCRQLVRLAVREDLDRYWDWTTVILVPRESRGAARIVARNQGVIAGVRAACCAFDEMQVDVACEIAVEDGQTVEPGQIVATLRGSARDLLTSERIALNFLGRLSGIATLTSQYVARIAGTKARLYDTRKTTPGWRRLEKYAVRCGGGHNHRTGLFDAVLIKDNHLAFGAPTTLPPATGEQVAPEKNELQRFSPAEAVRRARWHLREHGGSSFAEAIVEVEVDSLEQLRQVLPESPDIVLLDNMAPAQLRLAIQIRDEIAPTVELEASGGVNLNTIRDIGLTGIDRISVGALTHSATGFDLGLDWGE